MRLSILSSVFFPSENLPDRGSCEALPALPGHTITIRNSMIPFQDAFTLFIFILPSQTLCIIHFNGPGAVPDMFK